MIKKDLNEVVDAILITIKDDLMQVQHTLTLDFYDLMNVINRFSDTEKDIIITKLFNRQLKDIKENITLKDYQNIKSEIDLITNYYIRNKEKFLKIKEYVNNIADSILFNVLESTNKKDLITIDEIKTNCNGLIDKSIFYETMVWIIVRYTAIIRLYIWNIKDEEYECDKF